MDHLKKALSHCEYPKWAMDRVERMFSQLNSKGSNNANTQDTVDTKPTPIKSTNVLLQRFYKLLNLFFDFLGDLS